MYLVILVCSKLGDFQASSIMTGRLAVVLCAAALSTWMSAAGETQEHELIPRDVNVASSSVRFGELVSHVVPHLPSLLQTFQSPTVCYEDRYVTVVFRNVPSSPLGGKNDQRRREETSNCKCVGRLSHVHT